MEITEQQFNANLQNLSEMDQQNVIGIIQEIDGDELRSFAKALGVNIIISEEVAEEPMDATVDPAMDEMPMEEPPMEAPPAEVPPVEAPPAPVQPSMDQQMQQLALGDQVVEPVPEEAMPTEAMPTEAMPTEAVPMEAAPVDAVAGPIMQEGASETGVADDVPMDAEEGAYVVNAAAIERVGVRDFEERILKPNIESLRKKGVEISLEQLKSPAAQVEGDTDVAVSNGEYYLPPVLVKEIGLDLLEKINKRGEQETEERIAEEEAPVDPMQQQVQALKRGDRVKKKEVEALARLLIAEAIPGGDHDYTTSKEEDAKETYSNMQAVANVVGNRLRDKKTNFRKYKNYMDVISAKIPNGNYQEFSGYNDKNYKEAHIKQKERYKQALEIAEKQISGNLEDITGGATFFYNPRAVKRGGRPAKFFQDRRNERRFEFTGRIGGHDLFYDDHSEINRPKGTRIPPLPPKKPTIESRPEVVAPLPKEKPPTRSQQAGMRPGLDKVQNTMDTREIQQFPERVMQ